MSYLCGGCGAEVPYQRCKCTPPTNPEATGMTVEELALCKTSLYGDHWTMRRDAIEAVYGHIAAQARQIESQAARIMELEQQSRGNWIDAEQLARDNEALREALQGLMARTELGVEGGVTRMCSDEGRIAFYHRIIKAREKARAALGAGHESASE